MGLKVRYLHLCLSSEKGGAAISAMRLHRSMLQSGIKSEFLSLKGGAFADKVLPKRVWFFQKLYFLIFKMFQCKERKDSIRSFNILPTGVSRVIEQYDYDILVVHWIGAELMSLRELKGLKKQIYIVAHDLWWVGGCSHISEEYQSRKNKGLMHYCEELSSKLKKDLIRATNVVFISPSEWMKSRLMGYYQLTLDKEQIKKEFPIIPNIIPDSLLELNVLSKASDNKLIIIGAADVNSWHKGGDLIQTFLKTAQKNGYRISIFGALNKTTLDAIIQYKNVDVLGELSNEELIKKLRASDIYVSLSRVDNLPNIVLEALSCGCYVIGFRIGGIPNIITDIKLGCLAEVNDVETLVSLIDGSGCDILQLRSYRREHVKRVYSAKVVLRKLEALR